jgi:peptidoglycan hydrolase CwlO-like protein
MVKFKKFLTALILFIFGLMSVPGFIFSEDMAKTCQKLTESSEGCPGLSSDDCKALLQKCSDYYDQQSAKLSQDITKTSQQKNTLSNQIKTLQSKIKNLDYQINQSTVKVKGLSVQITDTQSSISDTSLKIREAQGQIASVLRAIYEEDKKSSVEILLEGNLSDFFNNLVYLESLNSKINSLLDSTKKLQGYLQDQKIKMDGEIDQLQKTIAVQSLQKQESERTTQEQDRYLKLTEAQYQQQLQEKKEIDRLAAEIKSRIFQLAGVADSEAPNFGQAVEIAKYVESITGVRAALVLAVLQQESGIGKNVGQCYLKDTTTGSGVNIRTGVAMNNVMKPMGLAGRKGDIDDFLTITKELGRDPFATQVSCPIPSVGGYGGAMGPAQFIPTTWMAYRGRLASILGRPADPWSVRDAFLATGLYLSNFGAGSKVRNDEWCAAQAYFTGIKCNTNHRFYGDSVLRLADQFENDIKLIGG